MSDNDINDHDAAVIVENSEGNISVSLEVAGQYVQPDDGAVRGALKLLKNGQGLNLEGEFTQDGTFLGAVRAQISRRDGIEAADFDHYEGCLGLEQERYDTYEPEQVSAEAAREMDIYGDVADLLHDTQVRKMIDEAVAAFNKSVAINPDARQAETIATARLGMCLF